MKSDLHTAHQMLDKVSNTSDIEQKSQLLTDAAAIFLEYGKCQDYLATQLKLAAILSEKKEWKSLAEFAQSTLNNIPSDWQPEYESRVKVYTYHAIANYHCGNYKTAFGSFEKVLQAEQLEHGEQHVNVARMYGNVGNCHYHLSRFDSALECYQKGLKIRQLILPADHPQLAFSYSALGRSCYQKRDFETALLYHRKALDIRMKSYGDLNALLTYSLTDVALCYFSMVQFDKAIEHFQKAIDIRTQLWSADHPSIAMCYKNMGLIYKKKDDFEQSLACFEKAAVIQQKTLGNKHADLADSYAQMGHIYSQNGDKGKAVEFLQKSLDIRLEVFGRHHEKVASVYDYLGRHYTQLGEYRRSAEHFQQATVSLFTSFTPTDLFDNPPLEGYYLAERLMKVLAGKANSFYQLFLRQNDTQWLQHAFDTYQLTIELTSHMRLDHQAESARFLLANQLVSIFESAIEVAFEFHEKFPELKKETSESIFTLFEKSKAITLLAAMKEEEAKTTANISEKLLKKEKKLKKQLTDIRHRLLIAQENPEASANIKQLENLEFDTHRAYRQLTEQLEKSQPEYYQLKNQLDAVTPKEVLQQLGEQTLLVEYFVGEAFIYTCALHQPVSGSDSIHLFKIPKPENFTQLITSFRQSMEWMDEEQFAQTAYELYRLLLKPITAQYPLIDSRLIIIPHAELLYISFETLLTKPVQGKDFYQLPYLIRLASVTYHYSATLWLHGIRKRQQAIPLHDSFLGIAPVTFDGSEQKELAVESNAKTGFRSKVFRSSNASRNTFESLPSSELEVKAVYELFQQQQKDAKALLYGAASKNNLEKYASQHKYLLISTHGFIRGKNARLSGIHLAKPRAEKYENEISKSENYQLYTSEAYHLSLNADLVVLSSCESGIGELHKGEGMVAINRGFLFAGAGNIIFSLFEVPDDATGKLIPLLFDHILQGSNYATALQKAKLALINNEDFTPQDWAGFVLIGG